MQLTTYGKIKVSTIFREFESTKSDRSAKDRLRHRKKVKDSIRNNIADIIADESIIGVNKNKVVRVPIKSIKEYRFIYGDNNKGVGQGTGKEKPGDIIDQKQEGKSGVGNQPGVDAIETEITIEELIDIMFDDLELPELERKAFKQSLADDKRKRKGVRKVGIRPRINKKLSAKNRVKRMIVSEEEVERFPFRQDDLRYFHTVNKKTEAANAVIFCVMDTSGSMGTVKKYLARSFYFLLYQFIKKKYDSIELVFIAHHTEASEVSENDFFHKVESGGTYISSAYLKVLDIIESRFHPSLWNIYAFHCSDGDNFFSDNEKTIQAAKQLCEVCNLFGYGEIKPKNESYYGSSMMEKFAEIKADNFQTVNINDKTEIFPALKQFLTKDDN